MYAIVKAGGHQEKVEVGDVILVNRLDAKKGDTVEFPVSLVVDGDKVTLAAADLAVPEGEIKFRSAGKRGVHSEHMGFILAEMQYLQRSYPGGVW